MFFTLCAQARVEETRRFQAMLVNWNQLVYSPPPLVLGPALAMERMPGPVCLRVKFSSGNLAP
jgi:hypothetical protein